jgi:hypothetical protein
MSSPPLSRRLYARAATAAKAVLPEPVRAPIERRIGARVEARRQMDLGYARVIREAPLAELTDRAALERRLLDVGLNDELRDEFPAALHHAGGGLRLWQYPNQFAPYLIEISRHGVRRYLEIGVRYGGSFVTTVEYLARFGDLEEAVAVDIDPIVTLLPYPLEQPAVKLMQADTQTETFERWVERTGPFDLAFVDGLHTLAGCRRDFESVRDHARLIAVHDIVNHLVPDVGTMWRAIRHEYADEFEFHEFVDQYPGVGGDAGHMGIGLAIRRA